MFDRPFKTNLNLEEMAIARENLDYLALIEDCDLFLFDRELNSKV